MKYLATAFLLAAAIAGPFINGCKSDKDEAPSLETEKKQVLETYAKLAYANYDDSYITAQTLQTRIAAFTAAPSAAGLEACKEAWKLARIPYGQSEVYRFYGGPIDSETGPEGLINAWPLDESYIDYVQGAADTVSIIARADRYGAISGAMLAALNEQGSETNIATGYHAIEFLLWGQDFSASGPGNRPFTDYTTATNASRRAAYLNAVSSLLVDNLKEVRDAWAEGAAYRTAFVNGGNGSLTNMFRGMGALAKGELGGERLQVAATEGRQEHEHSCFSDNTHVDVKQNLQGIQNVYEGYYQRITGDIVSGYPLSDLVALKSETTSQAATTAIDDAEDAQATIPVPFDQAILPSNTTGLQAIDATINSLTTVSNKLVDGAALLGLSFSSDV